MSTTDLAAELTTQYGHVLPTSAILATVAAALDPPHATAPSSVRVARQDVRALADAVLRSSATALRPHQAA